MQLNKRVASKIQLINRKELNISVFWRVQTAFIRTIQNNTNLNIMIFCDLIFLLVQRYLRIAKTCYLIITEKI